MVCRQSHNQLVSDTSLLLDHHRKLCFFAFFYQLSFGWRNLPLLLWIAVDLLSETKSRDSPELFNSSRNSSCTTAVMEVRKNNASLFPSTALEMCPSVLFELSQQSAPLIFFLFIFYPFHPWFIFCLWMLLSVIVSKAR